MSILSIGWIVFMAVAVVGGGLAAWWYSPRRRTLRAIREVQSCRIADAPEGALVRITGQLHAGPRLLEAPLSGRACACFRVKIQFGRSTRLDGRGDIDEVDGTDFLVDDGSGRALVNVRSIETALVLDHNERSGTLSHATPEQEAYLCRHGHTSVGPIDLHYAIRYREAALEPGEKVVVVGRARWEDDPELEQPSGSYRQSGLRKRLVIEAPEGAPVRVSDDLAALL